MGRIVMAVAMAVLAISVCAEEHGKAPHGGAMVELGEHFGHLEVAVDAGTGKISAYSMDCDHKAVRLKQNEIEIEISHINKAEGKPLKLKLKPVANVLTGEKEGETSEFSVQSDALKGAKTFSGEIEEVKFKGKSFKDVDFKFPEGSVEDEHGHDHKK